MPPTTPPSACSARWLGMYSMNLVGEFGDGQRLQPDLARAGERGEKDAVAAEDHVLDSGDALDLES